MPAAASASITCRPINPVPPSTTTLPVGSDPEVVCLAICGQISLRSFPSFATLTLAMSLEHAERPLVSIFMFVRNGGKSLRRAVDSVMAQTYPNIEFVVQDAVSTDGTLDVLRTYGDRIKLVSELDSGPSECLSRALYPAPRGFC